MTTPVDHNECLTAGRKKGAREALLARANRLARTIDGVGPAHSYDSANRLLIAVIGQSTTTLRRAQGRLYTWYARRNLTQKNVDGSPTTYGHSLADDDRLTDMDGVPKIAYDADGRKLSADTGAVSS